MKLKENVRVMFMAKAMGSLELPEIIDSLQSLGIDYLFQEEIQASLDSLAADDNSVERLNATALRFTLDIMVIRYPKPPRFALFRAAPTSSCKTRCMTSSVTSPPTQTIVRRTANYHPNIWDFDFIQSLTSDYTGDKYVTEITKLKENVRIMFKAKGMGSLALLELIDSLQRLGIDYLFQKEIQASLDTIAADDNSVERLNATELRFRLLREYGYQISQEVFIALKDATGSFDASLSKDIKGLLSLYEASYLAVEGESMLDEAKAFAIQHLKNIKSPIVPILAKQVIHSLELPLYWRISRLDARWYIEGGFSGEYDTNPDILELARLDFNAVQAIHQNDLKDMSRWWRDIGLGSHAQLSFARDRLMENFLWTIGVNFNPQLSCFRKGATKVNALITTIDDVYDVYGTLEELEFFTDAVERWDINAIEKLPNYMKICFLALYNSVNEIAYETLREQGWDIIHYLKKSWADLCKTYLVEAKWYYNKYTPTLEEYLNNAWISIARPVILVHAYFLMKQETNNNVLKWLEVYPDIVRSSSMILRLCDDLGTSTAEIERGDVPKSIQCYMNETGCSEETAREHIRNLISKTWKKMNTYLTDDSVRSKAFAEITVNLARMAQCMYQYGDGHGIQDQETKGRVLSLIVEPITLARHEAAN